MDFRKESFPVASPFGKKNRPISSHRSLQIESLENREMLAVSILSSAVEGFASTQNTSEIRFEVTTDNGGSAKIDFDVSGESGLDLSRLSLYNNTTGKTVALSDIVDGTTTSSASAILSAGNYSLYVGADSGAGIFSVDILHDDSYRNADPVLEILVSAALAQQQSGWANRKAVYVSQLQEYGYGANALDGKISDLYPQVDLNGDGVINSKDLALAKTAATGTKSTPSISETTEIQITDTDLIGPSITVGLNNDTGTPGDNITVDTEIVGNISDPSGGLSAQYSLNGSDWVALDLDGNGNYKISGLDNIPGTYTITVQATDRFGNLSTQTIEFVYPEATSPGDSAKQTVDEGGSVNFSLGSGYSVQKINEKTISQGGSVVLADGKGTVSLAADGSLTFKAGSYYDSLAAGQTDSLKLIVTTTDEHGRSFETEIQITVAGKNNLPTLVGSGSIVVPGIDEGKTAVISVSDILSNWQDVDKGATLHIPTDSLSITSVACSNPNIVLKAEDLASFLSIQDGNVIFNAENDLFKQLGLGENLTIRVSYKVSDGTASSLETGELVFVIKGLDDPSSLKTGVKEFDGYTDDLNDPLKSFDPDFSVSDPDKKDQSGFEYFVSTITDGDGNTIDVPGLVIVDSNDGTFKIDTEKLTDRDKAIVLNIGIGVRSVSGGEVYETITVDLVPMFKPSGFDEAQIDEAGSITKKPTVESLEKDEYTVSDSLRLAEGSDLLPQGVAVADVASIDGEGKFVFNTDGKFDYLKDNESLVLIFEYEIIDAISKQTGIGQFVVTITGIANAAIAPDKSGSDETKPLVTVSLEDDDAEEITLDKEDLLDGWVVPEGADQYDIVEPTVGFGGWSDSDDNPFEDEVLGNITYDDNGNLVFTPNAELLEKLGEGQWIDILIDYGVQNRSMDETVSGGQVIIRINGVNDPPTLTAEETEFELISNTADVDEFEFNPEFSTSDVDLNDDAESFAYEIEGDNYGFVIDLKSGNISISKENAQKLEGVYTLTVFVTDSQGATASKNIVISVSAEPAPELVSGDELIIQADESEKVEKDLTEFFVQKDGHSYSLDELTFNGNKEDLPDGFVMTLDEEGKIILEPGDSLAYLAEGETLELNFSFTVSVDGFDDCITTVNFTVVFNGANAEPVWIDAPSVDVNAGEPKEIDWPNFVSDIDVNDDLYISKINGSEFDADGNIETDYGVFHYDAVTKTLTFTPSGNYDSLSQGEVENFEFNLSVSDGKVEVAKDVSATINGVNKAPVVADGEKFTVEDGQGLVIDIDDRFSDVNENDDEHTISQIQIGDDVLTIPGETIELPSGVTVTISDDGKSLIVDVSGRTTQPADGYPENFDIRVWITDGMDESSEPGVWSVVINCLPPLVEAVSDDEIMESNLHEKSYDLNDKVSDANIPNRDDKSEWYEIGDLTLDGATLDGDEFDLGRFDSDFCTFEDGVLSFSGAENLFNFLAEGEKLVLTFSYTVRDSELRDANGNLLKTQGEIVLTITGVNNAPVIDDAVDKYHLTNSNLEDGAVIDIGDPFEFSDVDESDDAHEWSIENVAGKKGYENIDPKDLPTFAIDENGQITLINSGIELKPGESAIFTFDIVVREGKGGEDRQTITVTVYGKEEPTVDVENIVCDESGVGNTSVVINVDDPTENFNVERGEDWYDQPEINVELSDGSAQYAGQLDGIDLNDLFEVTWNDDASQYELTFKGTKEQFAFLKEGDDIVFNLTVLVRDNEYNVTGTTELTCTINGVGDTHSVDALNDPLTIWANETDAPETIEFNPGYDIQDADHDETYGFALDEESLPDEVDPAWIVVDPETGNVTLDREKLKELAENTDIRFTVIVKSTSDGIEVPVELTINVKFAEAPVVKDDSISTDENTDKSTSPNISAPDDDAPRSESGWYTISPSANATLVDQAESVEIPEGLIKSISATINENGTFVFKPGDSFDFLGVGEYIVLQFQFTVTDAKYDTESTWTVTLRIDGVNDAPEFTDENVDGGQVGGEEVKLGNISDWATDLDANDVLSFVSIGGIDVIPDEWFQVDGQGSFRYDFETGDLWYRADGSDLESLRHGVPTGLDFGIVVSDQNGEQTSGVLTVSVTGTNKQPQIDTSKTNLGEIEEGQQETYDVADFITDQNEGDADRAVLYSIDGNEVVPGEAYYLSDGTAIIVSNDGKSFTIDTSNRRDNMADGESDTRSFTLIFSDGSGAVNQFSESAVFQLKIGGIDDAPVMEDQTFVVGVGSKPNGTISIGAVDFSDADTAKENYEFSISENSTGLSFVIDPETGELVLNFANKIGTFDKVGDSSIGYELYVTIIAQKDGCPGETATAKIIVTFVYMESPEVVVDSDDDGIAAETSEGNTEKTIVEFEVVDKTIENREGTDWYTVDKYRFAEAVIYNSDGQKVGTLTTLPYGVVFGIDDDGHFYFDQYAAFDGRAAFDFLGEGEYAILVFEITVQDKDHDVQTVAKIQIKVEGVNNAPTANEVKGDYAIPANSTEGIKYYLSDLASDVDVRDKLQLTHVNGTSITAGQDVRIVDEAGKFLGTVSLGEDENGVYLLFKPNHDLEGLKHGASMDIAFSFTVFDGTAGTVGNIRQEIIGVNRIPEFKDEISLSTDEKTPLEFGADDLATDLNGDSICIAAVQVQVGDDIFEIGYGQTITLESGATITLTEDGRLVYNPKTRSENLAADEFVTESVFVRIADDSGTNSSLTDWQKIDITVNGVNDAPTGDFENVSVEGMLGGDPIEINLDELFKDADGDILNFNLQGEGGLVKQLENLGFVKSVSVVQRENGTFLVITFNPKNDYSNDYNFKDQTLTLVVDDGIDSISRTLVIKASPTVELNIKVEGVGDTGVEIGGEYNVSVSASELINELLGSDAWSHGLSEIAFTLAYDTDLCEVVAGTLASIGTVTKIEAGLYVVITQEQIGNSNSFDLDLLSFKAKATEAGTVHFIITGVTVTRNGEHAVDVSQIGKGVVSVRQYDPAETGGTMYVGYSTSNITTGYSMQVAAMTLWSSATDLQQVDSSTDGDALLLLANVFDDNLSNDILFDSTGFSSDEIPDSNLTGIFDENLDEILDEILDAMVGLV